MFQFVLSNQKKRAWPFVLIFAHVPTVVESDPKKDDIGTVGNQEDSPDQSSKTVFINDSCYLDTIPLDVDEIICENNLEDVY